MRKYVACARVRVYGADIIIAVHLALLALVPGGPRQKRFNLDYPTRQPCAAVHSTWLRQMPLAN